MVASTLSSATLKSPQGEFALARFPLRANELLQAFDAADEYLLEHFGQQQIGHDTKILLLNDQFGALAVALQAWRPVAMSDSLLSHLATHHNLQHNNLPVENVKLRGSLQPLAGIFDHVLIKVPKTLGLLEDQLHRIHPHLGNHTQVSVAGMIKNLSPTVWTLLERLLGPTTTSLAKKKARLIFTRPDLSLTLPPNPYPVHYRLENTDYLIANHANVFSRARLDIGTRFFLEHLPNCWPNLDIIDLGCGNGLVGIIAAERNPGARLLFVDESFMAVASAEENFRRALGEGREARFRLDNGLATVPDQSADVVLCNPPFHQQHTVGDHIAVGFFKAARRVLRNGGELWVIGNRHLNYHGVLRRWFHRVSTLASNAKFVILKAETRPH